ncbi:hypothetical protein PFISCL1PPCAC_4228, partial [Pristionchus fissidentatus]
QPPLTLESLPIENILRIVSSLDLPERATVRQCSKTMKRIIESSDFVAYRIDIKFKPGRIKYCICSRSCIQLSCSTEYVRSYESDVDALQRILGLFERSFRRAHFHVFRVITQRSVEDAKLNDFVSLFNFHTLNLQMDFSFEQSALDSLWDQRIDTLSIQHCAVDTFQIDELPRVNCLFLAEADAISDEDLVRICRQEHGRICAYGDLTDVATIRRIMQDCCIYIMIISI